MCKINFLSFQEQITYIDVLFIILIFIIIYIYSNLYKISSVLLQNTSICSSEKVADIDHLWLEKLLSDDEQCTCL